jgi:hypothetical protein
MSKQPFPNLKKQNARHSFRITIRDRTHFYKIVNWLNENVGKGTSNWTMEGRVLKGLRSGKKVSPEIYIYSENFNPDSSLYLTLL